MKYSPAGEKEEQRKGQLGTYTDLERLVVAQNKELATLHAIAVAVSQSLDLNDVLDSALDKTLQVMELEAGSIYLLEEETGVLKIVAQRGFEPDFVTVIDGLKLGEGFLGSVAKTGQPLLVGDVSTDPRLSRMMIRDAGLRSAAIVPLSSKGKVLGTFFAIAYGYREFSEQDVQLLTSIGHQVGVAIENARLYEDTKSQLAQLTALQETTKAVASTLELDQLLNLIIRQATDLLNANGGILNLVHWETGEDEVVACVGSVDFSIGWRSSLEISLSGWVTLHNQPIVSSRLQSDERVDQRALSWLAEQGIQSAAVAPLTIKNRVMGTLVVIDKQEGHGEFSQRDLDLLVAFSSQAATAIENARLYEQAQQIAALEERNHLARELHDSAKQQALAASFQLGTAITLFERDPQTAKKHLLEANNLVDGVRKELSDLIIGLRTQTINKQDFTDTLAEYAVEWANQSGNEININIHGQHELPFDIGQTLYRIMQEALANIARHSAASSVDLSLIYNEDAVTLTIIDDGSGFDSNKQHNGMGLRSMRERAKSLNGKFTIESKPGQGTTICVTFPTN